MLYGIGDEVIQDLVDDTKKYQLSIRLYFRAPYGAPFQDSCLLVSNTIALMIQSVIRSAQGREKTDVTNRVVVMTLSVKGPSR